MEKLAIGSIDLDALTDYINNKDEYKKHLKGYIFDSLVYRYQLALYKASLKDAEDIMMRKDISRKDAEAEARINYNRDMMRFCEILNEAIGDHD
jgi:hypothetical protein